MDILKEFQSSMHDVCEASMSAYIQSEQYRKEQNNMNNLITQLKQSLNPKEKETLIRLVDLFTEVEYKSVEEAYTRGFVDGVSVYGSLLHKK